MSDELIETPVDEEVADREPEAPAPDPLATALRTLAAEARA